MLFHFGIPFSFTLTTGFPYQIQFPRIFYPFVFRKAALLKLLLLVLLPQKVFDIILDFPFYHSFAFQCSLSCSAMVSTPIAVRRVGYAPSYIHCSFALNRFSDSLKVFLMELLQETLAIARSSGITSPFCGFIITHSNINCNSVS